MNEYTYYGYANGWEHTPEKIKKCKELKHRAQTRIIGRCLTEVSCETCQYKYKIDSGD